MIREILCALILGLSTWKELCALFLTKRYVIILHYQVYLSTPLPVLNHDQTGHKWSIGAQQQKREPITTCMTLSLCQWIIYISYLRSLIASNVMPPLKMHHNVIILMIWSVYICYRCTDKMTKKSPGNQRRWFIYIQCQNFVRKHWFMNPK